MKTSAVVEQIEETIDKQCDCGGVYRFVRRDLRGINGWKTLYKCRKCNTMMALAVPHMNYANENRESSSEKSDVLIRSNFDAGFLDRRYSKFQ